MYNRANARVDQSQVLDLPVAANHPRCCVLETSVSLRHKDWQYDVHLKKNSKVRGFNSAVVKVLTGVLVCSFNYLLFSETHVN